MKLWGCGFTRRFGYLIILGLVALGTEAQEANPSGKASSNPEVSRAADEVYTQMGEILNLPIKRPPKASLLSHSGVRQYFVEEWKNLVPLLDVKTLEGLGLIPKGFPLDSFMLDVFTSQAEGFYDPESKDFYVGDWLPSDELRPLMAHELTHALEEQSHHLNRWIKAARRNNDAELARISVSEGTAMDAMIDYSLRDHHQGIRDDLSVPGLKVRLLSSLGLDNTPSEILVKAPPYIFDRLFFPYVTGGIFSQQFLKAHSGGWADLKILFANPPVSTQQIMHPQMYLARVRPRKVGLPKWKGRISPDWELIEENVMGEFNLDEFFKQSLDPKRADELASAWRGDRFATFEDQKTRDIMVVVLLALDGEKDAAQLSEALEEKYPVHSPLTDLFLRCVGARCLAVKGASREDFEKISHALGWQADASS